VIFLLVICHPCKVTQWFCLGIWSLKLPGKNCLHQCSSHCNCLFELNEEMCGPWGTGWKGPRYHNFDEEFFWLHAFYHKSQAQEFMLLLRSKRATWADMVIWLNQVVLNCTHTAQRWNACCLVFLLNTMDPYKLSTWKFWKSSSYMEY
jgi:hypothetical protein